MLQRQGTIMPTLKDVVEFLNDRAGLANHPFFTSTSIELKSFKRNEDRDKLDLCHLANLTTSSTKQDSRLEIVKDAELSNYPFCTQSHPLYRCEVFKSKPVADRREIFYRKWIFNCINSTEYLSKSCKSLLRCEVPGCGDSHGTLLHQPSPTRGNADYQRKHTENTGIPAITASLPSVQGDSWSTCATATVAESSEIFLQIIALRIIGNGERQKTTHGLIDSLTLP